MDGKPTYLFDSGIAVDAAPAEPDRTAVIDFYDEASEDYGHWSRDFNMHLGFYRWGINPFNRDAMLEQMNREIAVRLIPSVEIGGLLADLGCGVGSVARSIAKLNPKALIKGITLSPKQVRIASVLNVEAGLDHRIEILLGDYRNLPLQDNAADGAWAIESACYAGGSAKKDLIAEMARVLRPGGRFVVADCFRKSDTANFSYFVESCYRGVCRGWVLSEMPELAAFINALESNYFTNITVEEISWQIVPSLAHAPFAVVTFIVKKFLRRQKLSGHSIGNLKASLLAGVLGANRSKFGYFLISGRLAVNPHENPKIL